MKGNILNMKKTPQNSKGENIQKKVMKIIKILTARLINEWGKRGKVKKKLNKLWEKFSSRLEILGENQKRIYEIFVLFRHQSCYLLVFNLFLYSIDSIAFNKESKAIRRFKCGFS